MAELAPEQDADGGKDSEVQKGLTLLVVEDDPNSRAAMVALTSREATQCEEAGSLEEARKSLSSRIFDAALVDLSLPDGSGLSLLEDPDVLGHPEFIVITGDGSAESAVQALKSGALDYLTKPVDSARLRSVLANVQRTQALKNEVTGLRGQLRELGCFGALVGRSDAMQRVYDLIERVAPTDASVFVTGESGTGKELVADTVHRLSRRSAGPLLGVNCGAMSPSLVESELFGHEKGSFTGADKRRAGFFERASGGTLFLDEITEMPLELQVKLLRVLEIGAVTRVGGTQPTEVDVRVIAASNRDPAEAIEQGVLREDLYYRLNVFPVELPPLRAREGDVGLLAEHFLGVVNSRDDTTKTFLPRALARLEDHAWPGNVRELKNIVERAAILADSTIDSDCLTGLEALGDAEGDAPANPDMIQVAVGSDLAEVEKRVILATLEGLSGDKKKASARLGISLKTLYNRLNVYEAADQTDEEDD